MKFKKCLSDYTEREFLEVLELLFVDTPTTEKELDELVDHIISVSEHPKETDIIYYPEPGTEHSPEGVLKTIKDWRALNGKPGFKAE